MGNHPKFLIYMENKAFNRITPEAFPVYGLNWVCCTNHPEATGSLWRGPDLRYWIRVWRPERTHPVEYATCDLRFILLRLWSFVVQPTPEGLFVPSERILRVRLFCSIPRFFSSRIDPHFECAQCGRPSAIYSYSHSLKSQHLFLAEC